MVISSIYSNGCLRHHEARDGIYGTASVTIGTEIPPRDSPCPSFRFISTYEVRIDLGLWRYGLRVLRRPSKTAYTPGLDLHISTYHIVELTSPVFEAARRFDIETVRTLFASGYATPFDQEPSGYSLFDWTFSWLINPRNSRDALLGLDLLKFILSCGGRPTSLADKRQPSVSYMNFNRMSLDKEKYIHFLRYHTYTGMSWIEKVLHNINQRRLPKEQTVLVDAIRLLFQTSPQDPLSNWDVGFCITLESQNLPTAEIIKQQDQWPLELGVDPQRYDSRLELRENDRQIFEDEDGFQIALLLTKPEKIYRAQNYEWSLVNEFLLEGPYGIHSILLLYRESDFKEKIRTGCRNRISILLNAGYDPRGCEFCSVGGLYSEQSLEMSVTQYALYTDTLDLWQEALEHSAWNPADINDLFDAEQYLNIPELLDGEFEFKTRAENREEFLHAIISGEFDGQYLYEVAERLVIYLNIDSWTIENTIDRGRQALAMKSTPGSWHDDETPPSLVFGVDFFIWTWGEKSFASFEEYDKDLYG